MPEHRLRRNEEIRVSQVRLIDETGKQVGIVYVREALDAARDAGLDLIEVAPEANPPVCRIMDWGRYRFEQQRREREQKRKQRSLEVKSLRLRPTTDEHDFDVTRRKADAFLRDGHKVRVEVRFRGREITHNELGRDVLLRLAAAVDDVAEVETRPSMDGRRMFTLLSPRPEVMAAALSGERKATADLAAALASEGVVQDDDDDEDDDEDAVADEVEDVEDVEDVDDDDVPDEVEDDDDVPAEVEDVADVEDDNDDDE